MGDTMQCERLVSAFHNDDDVTPCGHFATVEVFSINGKWEPMCPYHADDYGLERTRPLLAPSDEGRSDG